MRLSMVALLLNFSLTAVREWTLPHFLNLVAYAVVLYLMSGLLYPVRGEDVIDFRAHFESNRPRFFTVWLVFQAVDFADAERTYEEGVEVVEGRLSTIIEIDADAGQMSEYRRLVESRQSMLLSLKKIYRIHGKDEKFQEADRRLNQKTF